MQDKKGKLKTTHLQEKKKNGKKKKEIKKK